MIPAPTLAPHTPLARARAGPGAKVAAMRPRLAATTAALPTPCAARASVNTSGVVATAPATDDEGQHDETDDEDPAPTPVVGERPGGEQGGAEPDAHRADHPRPPGDVGAERLADRADRRDRRAERDQGEHRAERRDGQGGARLSGA